MWKIPPPLFIVAIRNSIPRCASFAEFFLGLIFFAFNNRSWRESQLLVGFFSFYKDATYLFASVAIFSCPFTSNFWSTLWIFIRWRNEKRPWGVCVFYTWEWEKRHKKEKEGKRRKVVYKWKLRVCVIWPLKIRWEKQEIIWQIALIYMKPFFGVLISKNTSSSFSMKFLCFSFAEARRKWLRRNLA